MNALLKKLKARYSLKPPLVLQTDNGPEFKIQFERALDKEVKVTHGPAYTSNAQGEVENANKIWRGVMRRLLHSQKAEPQQWSKFVRGTNGPALGPAALSGLLGRVGAGVARA